MNTIDIIRKEKSKVVEKDYQGRVKLEYYNNDNGNIHGKFLEYLWNRGEIVETYYDDGVRSDEKLIYDINTSFLIKKINRIDDKRKNVKTYYKHNGALSAEYETKHIRNRTYKHGPYKSYFDNGKLKKDAKLSMGKFIHNYKEYDDKGRLLIDFNYKRGEKKVGVQKKHVYFESPLSSYNEDILETYREFYSDGDIKRSYGFFKYNLNDPDNYRVPPKEELKKKLRNFQIKFKQDKDNYLVEDPNLRPNSKKYKIDDITLIIYKTMSSYKYSYYYKDILVLDVKSYKDFI
jgi:hypothetical protein